MSPRFPLVVGAPVRPASRSHSDFRPPAKPRINVQMAARGFSAANSRGPLLEMDAADGWSPGDPHAYALSWLSGVTLGLMWAHSAWKGI